MYIYNNNKKNLYIILKDCSMHSVRGDFSLASVTYCYDIATPLNS